MKKISEKILFIKNYKKDFWKKLRDVYIYNILEIVCLLVLIAFFIIMPVCIIAEVDKTGAFAQGVRDFFGVK